MYTLLSALGVALFIAIVPTLFGVGAEWTVLPGVFVGVGGFIWMSRRISKRVEAVTAAADKEMANLQQIAQKGGPNAQAAIVQRFDRSVEILKRGFTLEKWQIGVSTMLNARIGMLLYSKAVLLPQGKGGGARISEAIPYLEAARVKGAKGKLLSGMWPAWAMLAVAYYKGEKNVDKAVSVFEAVVKIAPKEGLLWSMYAWILNKEKRLDDAIAVLARGKDASEDKRVTENLAALQNRKKMNMRAFGEQWYQFGLEQPKAARMQPRMGHPRARAGMRR